MIDFLIIGAGCVGAAIAERLSKYVGSMVILEKGTEPCQGETKANSAIIHGGYDAVPGSLKAKLNVKGNAMFDDLSDRLDFTFQRIGSMVLAFCEEDLASLERLMSYGQQNGVQHLEILSSEQAKEMEPMISDEVMAALYCPSTGIVDPFNYTIHALELAVENGAQLFTDREVVNIEPIDGGYRVQTADEEYEARSIINAAGLSSDQVAKMVGDDDFKIIPTKGTYRLFDRSPEKVLSKVLFQTPTFKGKGVLITPTYHGNIMIGPNAITTDSIDDFASKEEDLQEVDEKAKHSVSDLDTLSTIRIFTGVRAKPDTGDFMIYPSKVNPGIFHVGGIESPGLASSPAIAEYVEKLMCKCGVSLMEKDHVVTRLEKRIRMQELSDQEKEEKIRQNPAYGKIICRCETVSEGEIVDEIHRPVGAKTIDGVKRRVRPGMGRCQGGFCEPRVIEILARERGIRPDEVLKEERGTSVIRGILK